MDNNNEEDFIDLENNSEQLESNSLANPKKNSCLGSILKFLLVLFLIIVTIAGTAAWTILARVDFDPKMAKGSFFSALFDAEQSKKDVINVLLIGMDNRSKTDKGRTDTMMIATVNKLTKKIKLTSFMRDLYVEIPEHDGNRLNTAYPKGGSLLLQKTLMNNFGASTNGYMAVDFEMFQKIVEQIGGVKMELRQEEITYLKERMGKKVQKLVPGMNLLNGATALEYARARYVGNGDYERTLRQRKLLQEIFHEVKALNLLKQVKLAYTIMPMIKTDLSKGDLVRLAFTVLMMDTEELETFRIPIDDSFKERRIRGMSVLVPDLAINKQALAAFLAK
ncbi:MAG: LCP family protein [Clostridia bacterium]